MQGKSFLGGFILLLTLVVVILHQTNTVPGWAPSSGSWAGAPTSQEVAPLISAAIAEEVRSTSMFPMKGNGTAKPDPNPPLYIAGQEHIGTIAPAAGESAPTASHVAYWPMYNRGRLTVENMDSLNRPIAYAYKDSMGQWQVTLHAPTDETPWYRIW